MAERRGKIVLDLVTGARRFSRRSLPRTLDGMTRGAA